MSMKSSDDRYGAVAIAFHWSIALAVTGLLVLGFRAAGTQDAALKAGLLRAHVPLGIMTLLLTTIRFGWWLFVDRKPLPIAGSPVWQDTLARCVHLLFYVVIIAMALSGIGMVTISGAFPILFSLSNQPVPDFWTTAPRIPHGVGAFLLCAMIALHVAAAVYHQVIRRDALLSRMGLGRSQKQSSIPFQRK